MNQEPEVGRECEVPRQLDTLSNELMELQSVVSELASRLTPVLRIEPPDPGEKPETSCPQLSPLADQIRTYTRNLADETTRIRGLLGRLEV